MFLSDPADGRNGARGMVRFDDDGASVTTIFADAADLSTPIHEGAHVFINDLIRVAADRRTLAATEAGQADMTAARLVDVGDILREAGVLERAYDRVRQDPLGGEPDEVPAVFRPGASRP